MTTVPPFVAMGAAFVVSGVLAPFMPSLLRSLQSRQTISAHVPEHAQKQGTPTMGGIMVVIGVLAGLAVAGFNDRNNIAAALLVSGFSLVGFVDDYLVPRMVKGSRGLSWRWKLLMEIAAVFLALVASNVPLDVNAGITAFIVLAVANAYNFADGLDGLAGSLAVVLALALLVLGWTVGGPLSGSGPVLGAIVGAMLPFLVLNAPPAKVFMGDVGSLAVGAAFGGAFSSVFVSEASQPVLGGVALMGIVMVAELLPGPMQVAWVKLTGKRLFQFKTPIHHGLQAAGWPETRVVSLFVIVQLAACLAGLGWATIGRQNGL